MFLSRQGATIKISDLTEQEKKLVNQELFVAPVTLNDEFPKKFKVFKRNNETVTVPKFWALENLKRFPVTHEYGNIQSMNTTVKFTGSLRKELKQTEATDALLKQLRDIGGGILSLDTGFGKTVCGIYTACQLGVKTMILVHKKFLEEQFEETIKRFVPDAKISKVRGDSCDLTGDFIIASIQTLLARKYDNFDGVGCLIVDECFPRRQLILTNKGNCEIGMIYDSWKRGEEIEVQSFDELTKSFSFKRVTYAWEKTTEEPLIKISYSKSNLKCTPNHKLLTTSGWKQAREIIVGDLLISTYNPSLSELAVSKGLNPDQYQIMLGYSGCYEWNNTFLGYGTLRVTKTEYMPKKNQKVYDLEVEDNHTFVCSSHSLCGPVVHNCHHIAAESFSKTMFGISFKYIVGLSATPTRRDGLTRVLHWFLGSTAFEVRRSGQKNVEVRIVPFTHAEYKVPPPVNKRGDICYSSLMSKICDIHDRTLFVAEKTRDLAATGRCVIVLSHRRQHAIDIKNILLSLGVDAATYLGGDKIEPDAQVLCATYHLASEGYDNPRLSGLVLSTPSSDVIQACGRILRGGSGNSPIIIDIVDQYSLFLGQIAKRRSWYNKIGFEITGDKVPPTKKIEEGLGCLFIDDA